MQVTLTLTRLHEPDALLQDVLAHLSRQTGVTGEILLIEQKEDSSIDPEALSNADWTCRTVKKRLPGLSAARNLSIEESRHDHILFCDADALAHPGWAAAMHRALLDPKVAVVGSRILPRWNGTPPLLARANVVRDQYSLYDLGEETLEVARVVGAGFGLDRTKFPEEMRFDENLGRRDGRLFGGEESDLCQRVSAAGGKILYVGDAVVEHVIQPERLRTSWILKRLYYAGYGRGDAGGQPNPSRRPNAADWLSLPLVLPPYALGWLAARLSRK